MNYQWHDAVGNVGVVLIVGAYLLVQLRKMEATSIVFSLVNAVGAASIMVSLVFDFNASAMVVEAFWLAISAIGVLRWWRERGRAHGT